MKANRVTWIKNLVGNILLMFLVLGLIPVLFCVVLFFNFVNTLIIPQREPNTKYLFFFFSQSINAGRWELTKQCFLPDRHRSLSGHCPSLDLLIEGTSPDSQECFQTKLQLLLRASLESS